MAVLDFLYKKVRAASLVEVLVASVLIVIVFAISSLSINNLLKRSYGAPPINIESRLKALEYAYLNNKLKLPYFENFQDGEISIFEENKTSCFFKWKKGEKEVTHMLSVGE